MRHTQNRRSRGRSRKGPNPLTRSYESNGPDVKVRGTAAHVAEKYSTLARDAQVSSDMISAENYLQHAEHYYRIVAAAQEVQFQQAQQAQQAQQRDGSSDERDGGRHSQNLDNNEGRDQLDGPPKSMDDRAAEATADDANSGDDAGLAQPERDVAGGGHDKAERPRRSRRPRAATSDEASAGTASAEPNPVAASEGEASARGPARPNGRRRKPAGEGGAASAAEEPKPAEVEGDTTQDGASALAAFRD